MLRVNDPLGTRSRARGPGEAISGVPKLDVHRQRCNQTNGIEGALEQLTLSLHLRQSNVQEAKLDLYENKMWR